MKKKRKKISCFLFFILFFSVFNFPLKGQSYLLKKKVRVGFDSITIAAVLDTLSRKENVNFSYNSAIIPANKKISLDSSVYSIEALLRKIMPPHDYQFDAFENYIIIRKKGHEAALPESSHKTDTNRIVRGKVVDQRTGDPLAYAHIRVSDNNLGTVSNSEGFFRLKLSPSLKDESFLRISSIGFKTRKLLLSKLDSSVNVFELRPEKYPIREITVRMIDPDIVIQKAIKKVDENYINNPVLLTSFFREANRIDSQYVSLSEAVLQIYKSDYSSMFKRDYVKLIKGRKNKNLQALKKYEMVVMGGLYNHLKLDVVKNRPGFFRTGSTHYYRYSYDGPTSYKNRPVYKISFTNKEKIDDAVYKGHLYIDQKDYAIVRADFYLNENGLKDAPEVLVKKRPFHLEVNPVYAHYSVNYQKIEQYWIIHNVRSEVRMKLRNQKENLFSVFSTESEFIVTQSQTERVEKFDRDEVARSTDVFVDQIEGYDEDFWGGYNIIQPNRSLKDAYRQLNVDSSVYLINNQ